MIFFFIVAHEFTIDLRHRVCIGSELDVVKLDGAISHKIFAELSWLAIWSSLCYHTQEGEISIKV